MAIAFHPDGAAAFDSKAESLVASIREYPLKEGADPQFPSQLFVSGALTEKDIIGAIAVRRTDYRGKTTARFFHHENRRFGLEGEAYLRLHELVRAVTRIHDVGRQISDTFVELTLFEWISIRFINQAVSSFSEFLATKAKEAVKRIDVWVPIESLEVEVPFRLAQCEVRPVTTELVDQWSAGWVGVADQTETLHAQGQMQRLRKEIQGLAAIVIAVEAEPERAFAVAIDEAEIATAILAVFSGAALLPDAKCPIRIKGAQSAAGAIALSLSDGQLMNIERRILDAPAALPWRIGIGDLQTLRDGGMDRVSHLQRMSTRSEFQNAVLTSCFLYAKAALTDDPIEKIVYVLASLESILLANETEVIGRNLSERLAMFIGRDLQVRKLIIKHVRDIYGIRSRYLHHGRPIEELESIRIFLWDAWLFQHQLIANADRFSTKQQFVNTLDDMKMS
jgi:hypothetical protein